MSDQSSQAIRHWWVTQTEKNPDKQAAHWKPFFTSKDPKRGINWEGGGWVKGNISVNRIGQMKRNDIVVAYQAREGIIGLVRLDSPGYPDPMGKGKHCDTFDLNTQRLALLSNYVPYQEIANLSNAKRHIEFVKFHHATVSSIDETGFKMILGLILEFNPDRNCPV